MCKRISMVNVMHICGVYFVLCSVHFRECDGTLNIICIGSTTFD